MMDEKKIAQLTMIQNVITRMGSNSFLIKGWSITALVALFTYWLTKHHDSKILLLILVATIFFWLHDAYYLRLERGFREFYDRVRAEDYTADFEIKPIFTDTLIGTALKRPILSCEYGAITLITIILLHIY